MPEKGAFSPQQASGLAWSCDGRHLIIAVKNANGEPYLLAGWDTQLKKYSRLLIGNLSSTSDIACSKTGQYVAVSSWLSHDDPALQLWQNRGNGKFQYERVLRSVKPSQDLLGIRRLAFAASEQHLIAVSQAAPSAPNVLAHWDVILLLTLPDLRIERTMEVPDEICALSWRANQAHLVLCGSHARTFMLDTRTGETLRLPFHGGLCRCHPEDDDLCAFVDCYNIAICRLSDGSVVSEQLVAQQDMETLDMCWSIDGGELFAASGTGRTYVYAL